MHDRETGELTAGPPRMRLICIVTHNIKFKISGEVEMQTVLTTMQGSANTRIPINLGVCVKVEELLPVKELVLAHIKATTDGPLPDWVKNGEVWARRVPRTAPSAIQ